MTAMHTAKNNPFGKGRERERRPPGGGALLGNFVLQLLEPCDSINRLNSDRSSGGMGYV
jgi:hypothetical protein